MNGSTRNLIIVSIILVILIAIGTIQAFVGSMGNSSASNDVIADANVSVNNEAEPENETLKTEESVEKKKVADYEKLFLEYAKENIEYFSRGMLLCDLNDDSVPELFSLAYEYEGDLLRYHEFNGETFSYSPEKSVQIYIDISSMIQNKTYFEDVINFFGVYKNRVTGEKALISSIVTDTGDNAFDVISYDGDKLVHSNEITQNDTDIYKKRDSVMKDYEFVENGYKAEFLLRGSFVPEQMEGFEFSFNEFIETSKDLYKPVKYDKAKDGKMLCYIRNIDVNKKEVVLVPVATIGYEEYTSAMEKGNSIDIHDNSFSIHLDRNENEDMAVLFEMPWFEYNFKIPTAECPVSVIEGYMKKTPVSAKISNDFKIRYGLLDECAADEAPSGYETLGREQEYTLSEYILHYAEYKMNNHYVAHIKNNEVVMVDVLYHP